MSMCINYSKRLMAREKVVLMHFKRKIWYFHFWFSVKQHAWNVVKWSFVWSDWTVFSSVDSSYVSIHSFNIYQPPLIRRFSMMTSLIAEFLLGLALSKGCIGILPICFYLFFSSLFYSHPVLPLTLGNAEDIKTTVKPDRCYGTPHQQIIPIPWCFPSNATG